MSRSSMLVLLGTVTILAPLSGFPVAIRSIVSVICGAAVVGIGLGLRAQATRAQAGAVGHTPAPDEPQVPHAPTGVSPI